MENKNSYYEARFDSFLNKTIILSSKDYYRKQMNITNTEKTIVDDEEYNAFLQNTKAFNTGVFSFDNIDLCIELNNALSCLSDIEQAVIFLLFQEELTQSEAAEILEIYSKTVSKIKIRAINKLRKYLKGDKKDER